MRAWSDIRVTSRVIPLTMVVVGLAYIYVPIQYELKHEIQKCPGNQGNSAIFTGFWSLLVFSLGPSIIMLTFGSLTIRHVRQSVRQIASQNTQTRIPTHLQSQLLRRKTTDQQLIRMMIGQCVYFSLLSTPVSIFYIWYAMGFGTTTDPLQSAKNELFPSITGMLSFASACTSFYLFTLSSQLFRDKLMHLFIRCRPQPNPTIRMQVINLPRKR
jgi:hypothetical protein